MNKYIAAAAVFMALISAQPAIAQTYAGACTTLTRDLSIGMRGSDVTQLQNFLVAQNYPGGGSWMVTGYYGAATQAAVRIFQQTRGLPQTGIADAATRGAISSCGSYSYGTNTNYNYNYNSSYPYSYQYQYQNQYPYNQYPYTQYPYNTYGTLSISSITPTSASVGNSVTIYGTGFDYSNNTVYVNGATVTNVPSYNGTSLTFTVPYTAQGTVNVYVTNTRGTSNTLSLYVTSNNYYGAVSLTSLSPITAQPGSSVTVYGSGFDYSNNTVYVGGTALYNIPSQSGTSLTFTAPYTTSGSVQVYVTNSRGTSNALTLAINNYSCGTYPYYQCDTNGQLSVSYLSPNSGAVGSTVTVFGSGFSSTNNSVRFGNGVIANLNSTDGRTLSFTVPSSLTGYGSQSVGLGTYYVSVANSNGQVSNALPYTVTSLGSYGAPTIGSINGPTSVTAGSANSWTVTVNNPVNSNVTVSVGWGDGFVGTPSQMMYLSGQSTLSFQHTYQASGTYTITFTATNAQGQQNTATMTVTVTGQGSGGQTILSFLSPTSGRVGTQVILSGTGFTSDNTVHFGVGGSSHVYAINSNTIYFTIPSYVSSCDVNPGTYCFATQPVTPGAYQIYVTNSNGTTGILTFTVTQ